MSRFYQTTSIAYVNGPPHIGFALELIQADVVARYHRYPPAGGKGDEVFFLTGADEHGAKIVRAAESAGKDVKTFVDENAAKFEALKNILNISWDYFIHTSDQKNHWPQVVDLWNKLVAAGDIYKKNYQGLYCVGHESFVTEKDLISGVCKDHGKAPEAIEEENYFFRLSKYAKEIELRIRNNELRIVPESRAHEILNFINEGIEDISFSRPRKDLQWGIPVPGDDSQTIYVWADALANYLYPIRRRADWWPADVHFIGKDILRFHALYWPAMLLSANLSLPKNIVVHGHITIDGQKMSKTLGNIIDPAELVKKYGVDAVRYYLLREIPPHNDGDFSRKKFEERYNADLANGLGNFTARVLALTTDLNSNMKTSDIFILEKVKKTQSEVEEKLREFKFHEALAAIWDLIRFGDEYINKERPWEDKMQDAGFRIQIIYNCLFILQNIAELLSSFLPETSEKIKQSIESKTRLNLFPRVVI